MRSWIRSFLFWIQRRRPLTVSVALRKGMLLSHLCVFHLSICPRSRVRQAVLRNLGTCRRSPLENTRGSFGTGFHVLYMHFARYYVCQFFNFSSISVSYIPSGTLVPFVLVNSVVPCRSYTFCSCCLCMIPEQFQRCLLSPRGSVFFRRAFFSNTPP